MERNNQQKRKREEEDETLDRSAAKENKNSRSNGETSRTSVDNTECSICLESVSSCVMKSLPCAHVFHEICINEWLKKSDICPICRWPITVDTNDSPLRGDGRSMETFENYEDDDNESSGSELGGCNNDAELDEWSDESESDDRSDESESDDWSFESELDEWSDEAERDYWRGIFELDVWDLVDLFSNEWSDGSELEESDG